MSGSIGLKSTTGSSGESKDSNNNSLKANQI